MPATPPELTERQSAIFRWIVGHFRAHGIPPTVRDIGAAFGLSPNGVVCHIRPLAKKGYIELIPGSARGIRIAAPFRCRCCGGTGIEADHEVDN